MKRIILACCVFIFSACATTNPVINKNTVPKVAKNDIEQVEEGEQVFSLTEFCKENTCRKNFMLRLRTEDGELMEQVLELYPPVVLGEQISLLPSDEVFVEADIEDGKFINLKQVQSPSDKTISLNFSQKEDGVDMLLSIQNPFDKMMKFHINMIDFDGKPHKTSSCPVFAGKALYEHWPHAIPEIVISNIRVLDDTDTISCEY